METSARNTVNIEETFALIVRRVVEARRLAQGGGAEVDAAMARNTGMSVGSGQALGTRRAVTAPLSPLPGGPEKEMPFPDTAKERKTSKSKEFWRKMMCF